MTVHPSPSILSVATALPAHGYRQEQITAELRRLWAPRGADLERLSQLHRSVRVRHRHLALPLQEYAKLTGLAHRNQSWNELALPLAERALRQALASAGLETADLDHLFVVTSSGLGVPSLDAALANRMALRPEVKRTPMFGFGCLGGGAGLSRAADWLRGAPGATAALLSVELSSLTFQAEDVSAANLISSGLFGDGVAAVVLGGAERSGGRAPRVVATGAALIPGSEGLMGWQVVDSGFKVVLSARAPEVVRANARGAVDRFLATQGLARSDIRHWICHPGGPKILEAIEESLAPPRGALDLSWQSLADFGNLLSASVLFVLRDTLAAARAREGDLGLVVAMGPGFGAELLLLRW